MLGAAMLLSSHACHHPQFKTLKELNKLKREMEGTDQRLREFQGEKVAHKYLTQFSSPARDRPLNGLGQASSTGGKSVGDSAVGPATGCSIDPDTFLCESGREFLKESCQLPSALSVVVAQEGLLAGMPCDCHFRHFRRWRCDIWTWCDGMRPSCTVCGLTY